MKYLIPLIVGAWVLTAAAALAATAIKAREVAVQYKSSGVDAEYVHGPHCIDGRSF